MKTNDYLKVGNLAEARLNSYYAYNFNLISALFLVLVSILVVLYIAVGFEFRNQNDPLPFSKLLF